MSLTGDLSQNSFTLADLEGRKVTYTPHADEIGFEPLYDSFNLTLTKGQIIIIGKSIKDVRIMVSGN